MGTKTVYQCDAAGYFIGDAEADESPREPGVYLVPAGCVEIAPPAANDNELRRFVDGAWIVEAIPEPGPAPEPEPDAPLTAEQVRGIRLAAYWSESDPLKIEAEYDAQLAGTEPDYAAWLAKVAEIKARYPMPDQ